MGKVNIDRLMFLLGELHEARGKLRKYARSPVDEILADGQKIDLIKDNLTDLDKFEKQLKGFVNKL